jgi:hypothetical protein
VVEHRALRRSRLGLGNVDILGHATPRRFDRLRELCLSYVARLPNR